MTYNSLDGGTTESCMSFSEKRNKTFTKMYFNIYNSEALVVFEMVWGLKLDDEKDNNDTIIIISSKRCLITFTDFPKRATCILCCLHPADSHNLHQVVVLPCRWSAHAVSFDTRLSFRNSLTLSVSYSNSNVSWVLSLKFWNSLSYVGYSEFLTDILITYVTLQ